MDQTQQMGEERVSKLLVKFSIPAIIGMIVNAMYNVIDRIFIGNSAGTLGIAGITIGFPIMLAMMGFGMLIGIGATALISIRLGEGKKEEAELIIGNAFLLLVIISLVITGIGSIFLNALLVAFGASSEVLPFARDYMGIILAGYIFQSIGFGMNNMIRAQGQPRKAMATMLISAAINVILAPLYIFVFHWGIKGAAFATVCAQAFSGIWVLTHFLGKKKLLQLRRKNLRLRRGIVGNILAIGIAPFSIQMAAGLLNVILNKSLVIYGGDIAISGMGIINSVATLFLMPIFGICHGAQPIIGFNYGAQKYRRVERTLKYAMLAATAIMTVGFITTELFSVQLIKIFNNQDQELIRFASHAMRVFLMCLPIVGFQIVGANYFQAVGKARVAMILSLSRQVLILIPLLLVLPRFLELEGVLLAGPLADFLSSVITGIWVFAELKSLKTRHIKNYEVLTEDQI